MTIELKKEENTTTLIIEGRIDSNTSSPLQEQVTEALKITSNIILDFEKVSYISSAGLRVLLIGQKAVKAQKGKMELIHVSENVMSVLQTVGFTKILTII